MSDRPGNDRSEGSEERRLREELEEAARERREAAREHEDAAEQQVQGVEPSDPWPVLEDDDDDV